MRSPILISQKTLRGLNQSITKWEKVVSGASEDGRGVNGCGLCSLYNRSDKDCVGCPILIDTGVTFCSGTPYDSYELHFRRIKYVAPAMEAFKDELKAALQKDAEGMLAYLKGLKERCITRPSRAKTEAPK